MAEVNTVTQVTQNRFLNYYELHTTDRVGKHKRYFMASRSERPEDLDLETGQNTPNGVVIFSVYGEKKDRVVLVHQFRYPVSRYVYELPAGLIEKGENFREAGIREMKEETGLSFSPMDVDPMYERPFYNSVGMTDESCCMVFGRSEGQVSDRGLEDSEQLDVVLADREEAARILAEEDVAANCAYMLMQFIHSREDPLDFLRRPQESGK